MVPESDSPPPSHFPPDFSEGGGVEKEAPLPPSVFSGEAAPVRAGCNDPECGETSCQCTHASCPCRPASCQSASAGCATCGGEHWLFVEADEEGRQLQRECPDCPAPAPSPERRSGGQPEGLEAGSPAPHSPR
jgi:hypothetical protein